MPNIAQTKKRLFWLGLLFLLSAFIAFPVEKKFSFNLLGQTRELGFKTGSLNLDIFGLKLSRDFQFKQGLDIRGGTQVILEADMSTVEELDRPEALAAAAAVISRRVDFYGIAEPSVQTARFGESYRLIVELPGVDDQTQALDLVGQTAQLEFVLLKQPPAEQTVQEVTRQGPEDASVSAETQNVVLEPIGLGGKQLKRANLAFDQQTGAPTVQLEFDADGRKIFADVTQKNTGEILGIFLDGSPLMLPRISTPILDGLAVITGQFSVEEAKKLSVQLNAGALPVPIKVLEQRIIGASLGQNSVEKSIKAGLIGLGIVSLFMLVIYGKKGLLADFALIVYASLTLALYKIIGVTMTLPGIAGLILSIGMAVDANILIFERIKEELRKGKPFAIAMELGFGKAWDSIKDANVATILTALVLINPANFTFLNTSGLVRGFGVTLLIGVVLGLFTGVVVTRNLVRFLLHTHANKEKL